MEFEADILPHRDQKEDRKEYVDDQEEFINMFAQGINGKNPQKGHGRNTLKPG